MEPKLITNFKAEELEAWDDAFEKVENYLRAHRFQSKVLLAEFVPEILARAHEKYRLDPSQDPVKLASREADLKLEGWFEELISDSVDFGVSTGARGRLALLLMDAPTRWPQYMLRPRSELPDEFVEEFCRSYLKAGPDMDPTHMLPRPIDLGPIPQMAESTLNNLARWPWIPSLLLWSSIVGGFIYVFWLTR
ncbi:MAG: hypothetical protein O7C75_18710 [Verrucomicrobia bacterium]|nr:hypothetical protein [Verrucomicrobiota bacterium]